MELVQLLLDAGSEVNHVSIDGQTALLIAVGKKHIGIVKALIDAGADVNFTNEVGLKILYVLLKLVSQNTCALMIAVRNGSIEITKLLLESGADVKLISTNNSKGILVACEKGHFEIVQVLISAGASVNLKNEVIYLRLIRLSLKKICRTAKVLWTLL